MSDLDALGAIYDEVVKRFQLESERTRHLDDKTSNIMGFVGIIIGLLSGLGALVLKASTDPVEVIPTVLFFVALIALVSSFIFGLAGYRIKKFTVVPDAYFLIGAYENKDKERILRDLNDNYAIAIEENMKLNDTKVVYIKRAMYALLIAILLIPFFGFFATIG